MAAFLQVSIGASASPSQRLKYRQPHVEIASSIAHKSMQRWRQEFEPRIAAADCYQNSGALLESTAVSTSAHHWMTSMAYNESLDMFALTQGTRHKNVLLAAPTSQCKGESEGAFEMQESHTSSHPVFSVDWVGNLLLLGCAQNHVQLVETGGGKLKQVRQYRHPVTENSRFPQPPGKYSLSNRVVHVQFEPARNPRRFMALESSNLRVWDCETAAAPFINAKISHEQAICADWSLLCSQLIACSGVDKSVAVLDLRCMGLDENHTSGLAASSALSWYNPAVHSSTVRDIKWSPFVPHWIATAGDDHVVRVWDLRQTRLPVVSLAQHYDAVNSISWASSHGDIIGAGSSDGRCFIWQMAPDKIVAASDKKRVIGGTVVAEYGKGGSSIVKILPLTSRNNTFVSLSVGGDLKLANLPSSYLSKIISHRFSENVSPSQFKLENDIFTRNIDGAIATILDHFANLADDDSLEDVVEMLEMLRPMPSVDLPPMTFSTFDSLPSKIAHVPLSTLFTATANPVDLISDKVYSLKYNQEITSNDQELTNSNLQAIADIPPISIIRDLENKSSQAFDSVQDILVSETAELITKFCHFLPPYFDVCAGPHAIATDTKVKLERVKVIVRARELLEFLRAGKDVVLDNDGTGRLTVELLLDLLPDLKRIIEIDPLCVSLSALTQIVCHTISHDYVKSLEFGRSVIETCDRNSSIESVDFQLVSQLAHCLLFPTIYDSSKDFRRQPTLTVPPAQSKSDEIGTGRSKSKRIIEIMGPSSLPDEANNFDENENLQTVSISRSNALENLLRNPKIILPMIKAECRIQRLLHDFSSRDRPTDGPQNVSNGKLAVIAEKVIEIARVGDSISVSTTRAVLNAYLILNRFHDYFGSIFDLITEHPSRDFIESIIQHTTSVGIFRMSRRKDKIGQVLDPLRAEWRKTEILAARQFIASLAKTMGVLSKNLSSSSAATAPSTRGTKPAADGKFVAALESIHGKVVSSFTSTGKAFTIWLDTMLETIADNVQQKEKPPSRLLTTKDDL
eukprot:Partr_v1_DN28568_c0_g1_i2_m73099 putative NA